MQLVNQRFIHFYWSGGIIWKTMRAVHEFINYDFSHLCRQPKRASCREGKTEKLINERCAFPCDSRAGEHGHAWSQAGGGVRRAGGDHPAEEAGHRCQDQRVKGTETEPGPRDPNPCFLVETKLNKITRKKWVLTLSERCVTWNIYKR